MKALRKFPVYFTLVFSSVFLASCLSHEVAVYAPQPPITAFPLNIQKFVLLDLSGGRHESLCALQLGLAKDSSYTSSIYKADSNSIVQWRESLSWEKIAAIVKQDTTAGLIVLERASRYLRTDPTVATTKTRRIYNVNGEYVRTVTTTEYLNELYYTYQWKIYDLKSKAVLGTYSFEYPDSSHWHAGSSFANLLLPHGKWLSRKYYVSGGKNMRSAGFLVRKGQWAKACAMWEREAQRGSPRAKRKAYYNLAIANEKGGNYTKAIEYAQKARELGEPQAEFYLLILRNEVKALQPR
jgi:tetratricopeptide (TPR) repeat protein